MNVILCEYVDKNEYDAGNKARSDVMRIADRLGYRHIILFRSGAPKIQVLFQLVRGCLNAILRTGRNENIFIQYPYYPPVVNKLLFKTLGLGKKIKGFKMILLLHDVLGLRNDKLMTKEGQDFLMAEVNQMMIFDNIICHNEKMKECLCRLVPSDKYRILGPFDYLYSGNPVSCAKGMPWKIIVAGNLEKEKCGYIYKLPILENIVFELYGSRYLEKNNENSNVVYNGSFPPEELIKHLDGHFGLVWDGDSCDTNTGVYGQYLRYNNPHKFSLYIAAGIPLIVWSQSALADCVRENHLGICIESLKDLKNILDRITLDSYEAMVRAVGEYRKDVIAGNHLKLVLNSME